MEFKTLIPFRTESGRAAAAPCPLDVQNAHPNLLSTARVLCERLPARATPIKGFRSGAGSALARTSFHLPMFARTPIPLDRRQSKVLHSDN
jgi:hypothetical protein